MEIMTIEHSYWLEFHTILGGIGSCNFRKNDNGETIWDCNGDFTFTKKILTEWGEDGDEDIDVEASLEYFKKHGCYCDCEIIINF